MSEVGVKVRVRGAYLSTANLKISRYLITLLRSLCTVTVHIPQLLQSHGGLIPQRPEYPVSFLLAHHLGQPVWPLGEVRKYH